MTFRVLVADSMAQEGISVLTERPDVEVLNRAGISEAELESEIIGVHGLVVRSRTQVTRALLEKADCLKVVGRAGIGVDNIDVPVATRAGIVVMNTPDGNAITTAEHTLSLILSMSRRIPQATASLKAGEWQKKLFMGRELFGKTLGIVGLGNIGRIVADRARGLKMNVVAYDPFFSEEAALKMGVELLELDGVLRRADVLTCHTPLNEHTRNLISDPQIELMKAGAMLVNCARGGIYDEAALLRGLETGKLGGVALDVYTEEPPAPGDRLLAHPNVICTPHLGASTNEAQVNVAIAVADQIGDFLTGGPARNALNMPRLSASELRVLEPLFELSERLGAFVSQLVKGGTRRVQVRLHGEFPETAVGPVGSAAVAGALSRAFTIPVNVVNARLLAEERGIEVIVSKAERAEWGYTSTIEVILENDEETASVVGTLGPGDQGRVVLVNGIPLETIPEGHMLLIENEDIPGVIGKIGTKLGNNGINISRMQLGLCSDSGRAISIVSVDQAVSDPVVVTLIGAEILKVTPLSLPEANAGR